MLDAIHANGSLRPSTVHRSIAGREAIINTNGGIKHAINRIMLTNRTVVIVNNGIVKKGTINKYFQRVRQIVSLIKGGLMASMIREN